MKKFTIYTDNFEFRFSGRIPELDDNDIRDLYLSKSTDPHFEAQFDNEAEARAEFETNYSSYARIRRESAFTGAPLLVGDLAYLEEAEYTEDGEFDQGGDWIMESLPSWENE